MRKTLVTHLSLMSLLFCFPLNSRADSAPKCELKSGSKIGQIYLLASEHKISDAELQLRLAAAYEEECVEVLACLDSGKWKGISIDVIQRVQLTWETSCTQRLAELTAISDHVSGSGIAFTIEIAKAHCAETHEKLSSAYRRIQNRRLQH